MEEFESLVRTDVFYHCLLVKMDRSGSLFWSRERFSEVEVVFMIVKNEISTLAFVVRLIDIGRTVGVEAVEIHEEY
jgi:hypothetical protein